MRSYIIDFTEPGQVAEAYDHFFQHAGFLLSTADQLPLSHQIRVRFNFPDGNGMTILARVVSEMPNQGYGLQLPDGTDLAWLVAKSKPYSDDMKKRRKAGAKPKTREKASVPLTDEMVTRPIKADEIRALAPVLAAVEAKAGPRTKPLAKRKAAVSTVEAERQGPSTVDGLLALPDAESLAPSERDLLERVAHLDKVVEGLQGQVPPGATIQAAPPAVEEEAPAAKQDPPIEAEAEPDPEELLSKTQRLRTLTPNHKKKLAISGGREEREILMRDPDEDIHIWVLKNPELELDEVVGYSCLEALSQDALNFLLHNRRWGTSPEVALNLALNPRIPPEAIPNLLTVLPAETLKTLVGVQGIRHLVSRQARRILMERAEL